MFRRLERVASGRAIDRTAGASSTVLAMILMHALVAQTAAKLAQRGTELSVFASPTIAGVTLYGVYRERMLAAQEKHAGFFRQRMVGDV